MLVTSNNIFSGRMILFILMMKIYFVPLPLDDGLLFINKFHQLNMFSVLVDLFYFVSSHWFISGAAPSLCQFVLVHTANVFANFQLNSLAEPATHLCQLLRMFAKILSPVFAFLGDAPSRDSNNCLTELRVRHSRALLHFYQ